MILNTDELNELNVRGAGQVTSQDFIDTINHLRHGYAILFGVNGQLNDHHDKLVEVYTLLDQDDLTSNLQQLKLVIQLMENTGVAL
jgi:hypothetical protein